MALVRRWRPCGCRPRTELSPPVYVPLPLPEVPTYVGDWSHHAGSCAPGFAVLHTVPNGYAGKVGGK